VCAELLDQLVVVLAHGGVCPRYDDMQRPFGQREQSGEWFHSLKPGDRLILRQIGSTAEARTALERAVEISPDSSFARAVLGLFDLDEGRAEAALDHFRRAGAGHSQAGIAMAEHSLGHARESLAALDELKRKYATGFALQIAQVHAWRGEKDAAFEWLDKAFAHRDPGLLRLRSDHQLAALKDDRRFAALLRQLNYPD